MTRNKPSDYFFILEAGVNHNGNLNEAVELVRSAARTGAHAIKFQTYTAEKLAAPYSPSYWNLDEESTKSQIELFKKYDGLKVADYQVIAGECQKLNIEFMTTCFDEDWVEDLDPLIKRYKIASADITNFPLLRRIASKNKPMYLSTGASSIQEIYTAVEAIREISTAKLCIMHCVLNYPTEFANANLSRITLLREKFRNLEVGYSDHTRPEFSRLAISQALTMGATSFEKHFTLDKSQIGNDHYHSFDEQDVIETLEVIETVNKMNSFNEDSFLEIQEMARKHARRGIYASKILVPGSIILESDLVMLRPVPDEGFPASEWQDVIGKTVLYEIQAGNSIIRAAVQ
jgi:N-acetylneuraminate synthase